MDEQRVATRLVSRLASGNDVTPAHPITFSRLTHSRREILLAGKKITSCAKVTQVWQRHTDTQGRYQAKLQLEQHPMRTYKFGELTGALTHTHSHSHPGVFYSPLIARMQPHGGEEAGPWPPEDHRRLICLQTSHGDVAHRLGTAPWPPFA